MIGGANIYADDLVIYATTLEEFLEILLYLVEVLLNQDETDQILFELEQTLLNWLFHHL